WRPRQRDGFQAGPTEVPAQLSVPIPELVDVPQLHLDTASHSFSSPRLGGSVFRDINLDRAIALDGDPGNLLAGRFAGVNRSTKIPLAERRFSSAGAGRVDAGVRCSAASKDIENAVAQIVKIYRRRSKIYDISSIAQRLPPPTSARMGAARTNR